MDAAREHGRKRNAWMRATRDLAAAEVSMSIKELADLLPEPPAAAPLPETKVVRPFIPQLRTSTALKPAPDEDDDLTWLKESNALARQQRAGLHLIQGGDGED